MRDPDAQGEWPGLVLEWRKQDGAWRALVVYLITTGGYPIVVQEWLPSNRLRPAEA